MTGPLSEQLTFGGVTGFATGYALSRLGRLALLAIGIQVLSLQAMAHRGWVSVHWSVIAADVDPSVRAGRHGGCRPRGVDTVVRTGFACTLPTVRASSAGGRCLGAPSDARFFVSVLSSVTLPPRDLVARSSLRLVPPPPPLLNRDNHVRSAHRATYPHWCSFCLCSYKHRDQLERHERWHRLKRQPDDPPAKDGKGGGAGGKAGGSTGGAGVGGT